VGALGELLGHHDDFEVEVRTRGNHLPSMYRLKNTTSAAQCTASPVPPAPPCTACR
jgi:hypothetical protein